MDTRINQIAISYHTNSKKHDWHERHVFEIR